MINRVLVDADIVAYRCASSAEQEVESWIPTSRVDELMRNIQSSLQCNNLVSFISGEHNFRKVLYPEYKANRTKPQPKWLQDMNQHLILAWGAEVTDGWEADDALAMASVGDPGFVIASIDKDLRQIPGNHYDFVKGELVNVSEEQALYNFYYHLLVGDSADNIKGAQGIGPVKATKALEHCTTPRQYYNKVRELFRNDEYLLMTARLIWLKRSPEDVWNPPQ